MKQVWAKNLINEMNICLCFKKKIHVEENMNLSVASNVPFRVLVNNELIGYGPRRMAHKHATINEYSLNKYIGNDIEISLDVVSYRVYCFYIVNQIPFVGLEIRKDNKLIFDAFDFEAYRNYSKLQKVQRFGYQRGFSECWSIDKEYHLEKIELIENEVCILEKCTAPYPKFVSIPAKEYESGDLFKVDKFIEYDDSYLNRHNSLHFDRNEQEFRISYVNDHYGFSKTNKVADVLENQYKVYQLERNATGFISFDVEVLEDCKIMINYDELLSPSAYEIKEKFRSDSQTEKDKTVDKSLYLKNDASNIDVYRLHSISLVHYELRKGKYHITSFEPDTMQYFKFYVYEGKARISNVNFILYENTNLRLNFECEDEDLNLMFESAINTIRGNAVDILTDCASRERAGWLCDSYFTGRAEKLITGYNYVERNNIQAFIDYQSDYCKSIPSDTFPMCYPSDMNNEAKYIPNWCMWFILEVNEYANRNNDMEVIQLLKDKFIKFVDYMLSFKNEDGLLEDISGWVFVEWSRANDLTKGVSYPTNMLFTNVLDAMSSMYGIEKYKEIASKMRKEIIQQSYNGKFFVDNATRDENHKLVLNNEWTETCQYYAFWCGIASKDEYQELFNIIFREIKDYSDLSDKYPTMSRANMFIGMYLRLDYLSRIRENKLVLENMKSFFLYQAKKTKTFWEYKTPTASCNHAFASLMCEWLIKATIGVTKINKNGIEVSNDGILKKAKASIPFEEKTFDVDCEENRI